MVNEHPAQGEARKWQQPILSQKLLDHGITAAKLAENAARYPEMQEKLSDADSEKVKKIRAVLLKLPLVHTTREESLSEIERDGIRSQSELSSNQRNNTIPLDMSLGLNEYTFFHWALPRPYMGATTTILARGSLLLNPRTIVSPADVGELPLPAPYHAKHLEYEKLTLQQQQYIQKHYFDTLVTGEQWLEIIARRVLQNYKEGVPFFVLSDPRNLGEIKVLGGISPKDIEGKLRYHTIDYSNYYRDVLYANGIGLEEVEHNMRWEQRYKRPQPQHIEWGINYAKVKRFWKRLLQ